MSIPKLLIKGNKTPDINGNFMKNLMIPATKFTATFEKSGYIGLKEILDNNQLNY